jgi:nitrite reductase (NADH) small subunit
MSELVRICSEAELPPVGQAREFTAGGKSVCVANVDGVICAVDNVCPHRGGPLAEGFIEEGKIVCPWHAWSFDPATGCATHFPQAKVEIYELSNRNGEIFVEFYG